MQTINGQEACSCCKEEYQAFQKYFVAPLANRALHARLARENAMEIVPTYQGTCRPRTLQEIVDDMQRTMEDCYRGLEAKLWCRQAGVEMVAYKPRKDVLPFMITLDRGPAHSFWVGGRRENTHLEDVGVSLLQIMYVCAHGHDLHQIVEHANGFIKGGTKTDLRQVVREGDGDRSKAELCHAVFSGVETHRQRYNERGIINRTLPRLRAAIKQVASATDVDIEYVDSSGRTLRVKGSAGRYASLG